jgi:hypothetical protein
VSYRLQDAPRDIARATAVASSYRVADASVPPSPEVRNAMRALREMPPSVRQREIDTGRYSHFSAEEREMLKSVRQ